LLRDYCWEGVGALRWTFMHCCVHFGQQTYMLSLRGTEVDEHGLALNLMSGGDYSACALIVDRQCGADEKFEAFLQRRGGRAARRGRAGLQLAASNIAAPG
jgi:hypothetical protein